MRKFILYIFLFLILVIESFLTFRIADLFSFDRWQDYILPLMADIYMLVGMIYFLTMSPHTRSNPGFFSNLVSGTSFSIFLGALLSSLLIFLGNIGLQVIHWIGTSSGAFSFELIYGQDLLTEVGLALGLFLALAMVYGVLIGRFKYQVKEVSLSFSHLPKSFDGYKIAQVSDLHLGSFDRVKKVKKGLDILQKQGADLIVFTGDLVNNLAEEALPYVDLLKGVNAPDGKFSILGNHDYADYIPWASKEEKARNLDVLKDIEAQMGFRMLNNESVKLKRGRDFIELIGVENWGAPPFVQHGDLQRATADTDANSLKILLSHDPSHWDLEVLKAKPKIDLTLSGHTHGMQFGLSFGKIKWSPVQYRYKRWGGLYEHLGQYLYVNHGFGHHGFSGRLGIWPEITLITLRAK